MNHDENLVYTFKNYMWSKPDMIGAGATSYVYKGLCQDNGNYFAVKVFNEQAKSRSFTIQQRELDLLCRINHENVVKLIDKDEQTSSHRYSLRLIVMEYCNGGSLATLIEEPENIYGLQQSEFLLVLKHITSGMSELHRLNIVHRDIKPNNILLQILPTGEHVYKLSDFGAAREIAMEDEQFTSICGTEEYLFPDVYERALINRNIQRTFRPGIDLWSTGVSLYHVATGMLPFRPIGGRNNRDTMIKITKDKPSGYISGIQNPIDGQIEYSNRLPETCQLSKNLQDLLIPMLAGLMENNYEKMWPFDKFFEHSSYISSLKFVNVMNLDTCQIIELPFENNVKLNDLKEKIEKETKIEKASQLLIYNNLLIDSLVTENQTIDTYPLMDKQHPCILFSLETSLTCDNLEIIKSIPNIRCKERPKTTSEILHWSKETCGSIYYIKREIYLVTMIIELLKLSAIAFKSYMPEMKLKNQSLLHNFKSSVKSLETKMNIIERLEECLSVVGITVNASTNSNSTNKQCQSYSVIKHDIKKFQDEIFIYESEINCLTNKINEIQNLEFLIQNSSLTIRWKKEADAYTMTAQKTHDEFVAKKKEMRYRQEQEKFESSKFTEFKIAGLARTKDEAVKLYQEVIIVHFYDFYLRFEKWMSDLIKLHNDIMSVQKKLIDCEREMNKPFEKNEKLLDARIESIIEAIVQHQKSTLAIASSPRQQPHMTRTATAPSVSQYQLPPTPSNTLSTSSYSNTNSGGVIARDANSTDSPPVSNDFSSNVRPANSSLDSSSMSSSRMISRQNADSIVASLKEFKSQATELEKALDENGILLKFLHEQFNQSNPANIKSAATNQNQPPTITTNATYITKI